MKYASDKVASLSLQSYGIYVHQAFRFFFVVMLLLLSGRVGGEKCFTVWLMEMHKLRVNKTSCLTISPLSNGELFLERKFS